MNHPNARPVETEPDARTLKGQMDMKTRIPPKPEKENYYLRVEKAIAGFKDAAALERALLDAAKRPDTADIAKRTLQAFHVYMCVSEMTNDQLEKYAKAQADFDTACETFAAAFGPRTGSRKRTR